MREGVGRRSLTDGMGFDVGEHYLEAFVYVFFYSLLAEKQVGLEDSIEVGWESLGIEGLSGFFIFFSLMIIYKVLSAPVKLT